MEQQLTPISCSRNGHRNFYQHLKIKYCQHQHGPLTMMAGVMRLLTLNHVCHRSFENEWKSVWPSLQIGTQLESKFWKRIAYFVFICIPITSHLHHGLKHSRALRQELSLTISPKGLIISQSVFNYLNRQYFFFLLNSATASLKFRSTNSAN